METLASLFTKSFQENWDKPMLTDYGEEDFSYESVAKSITIIGYMFEKAGVKKGDKIALYGRNSANWAKVFLSCMAYGAVAVPVLPDFIPENAHHILEHSEAKFLFSTKNMFKNLDEEKLTSLSGCIALDDFSVLRSSGGELQKITQEGLAMMAGNPIKREDFSFIERDDDELCVLSYTSGSSGFSKGVMIPVRSIYSNVVFAIEHMHLEPGNKMVSFLPMSHIFGLAFDFLFPVCRGCHLTIMTRIPSAQLLVKAYKEVKPHLILLVPLVIEKIYQKRLLPVLQKPVMKVLMAIPGINKILLNKVKKGLLETFGGRFTELIVGGAALSAEVEDFFTKIKFPITVGYGMTECGPLIGYAPWDDRTLNSAGMLVDRLEMRIDSEDPYNTVGEIQVKGENVMLGYFKNEEATNGAFTEDGWMRTGDLGITDERKFIYIKGRSKNMLLGPSGQNIYPEELEARLTNMHFVAECVIVQRESKLVALVYPDMEEIKNQGRDESKVDILMEINRKAFNGKVASYEQISSVEVVKEEFQKTPKKNIKRFLYT